MPVLFPLRNAPLRFRLAAGALSCSVGNRRTIFAEASQQLFEVDEITAYITSELSQATSFEELEANLVGEGMGKSLARSHLKQYLRFWSRRGLLQVEFENGDGSPVRSEFVEIAGRVIRVSCYDEALMELVRPMLPPGGSRAGSAFNHYILARFGDGVCIAGPGQDALIISRREAAPALKGLLTEEVITNLGMHTALHGALLANDSGAIFLCGSPGAGKTTLALALMQCGFQSYADDIALLHADGTISGVAFASAVKAHSWNLLPQIRESLFSHPVHHRLDGKLVRYLPPPPHDEHRSIILRTIVLLNRTRRGAVRTLPLEPLQVLAKMISEANNPQRRLSATQFESMLGVVTAARGIELTYSQLDEGAQALARFHDAG